MRLEVYDHLYIQFIYLFNQKRDYYQCHDVMEQLWLEEGRNSFFQGLLQVAVGCYHAQNGNQAGTVKLLLAALQKLTVYPHTMMGIDLYQLSIEVKQFLVQLQTEKSNLLLFPRFTIGIVDQQLERCLEQYQSCTAPQMLDTK